MKSPHPRAALGHRDFRLYLNARFLALVAHQMLMVAMGQYIYTMTHNPLHLGYIGLAIFFPKFALTLFAGHTADRYDRRLVILTSRSVQFFIVTAVVVYTLLGGRSIWILLALLFLLGIAYAFDGPASQAFVTQLVPPEHFSRAVAWNSSYMQFAFIVGPALGGLLYAWGGNALTVFYAVAICRFLSALLVAMIRLRVGGLEKSEFSWETLVAGIKYVFKTRIILGTISLDLFAVLLGGVTALLPIFANDILKVGPSGLGLLRAAPSVGAALMALTIAHLPPMKKAGAAMLWCVALYGIATVIFGVSKIFWLSLVMLFILGAADMVSVVIRHVLVQVKTPPEMRGRVSAVNLIFIGASNELGEFESGITAAWFGAIPAVIIGGVGTLLVVSLYGWRFPEIRNYERLDEM